MNIITQNCVGGQLYRCFLKTQYKNPFIWTVIDFTSMLYLIKHYDTINFKNYTLCKDEKYNFSIIVDSNIKIQYVHYKFSKNATKLIKNNNGDIFYDKISEYIVTKYEERVNRMLLENIKPVYCIANINTIYNDAIYTADQLNELTKYNNVIVLNNCNTMTPFEAAANFFINYFNTAK